MPGDLAIADGHDRICVACGAAFRVNVPSDPQRFCRPDCWYVANRTPLAERFAKLAGRRESTESDCWLWMGARLPKGYGHIWDVRRKRVVYAHRIAYELVAGPIPPRLQVAHVCDQPACVRNEPVGTYLLDGVEIPCHGHLFLATQSQNLRDMSAKGRNGPQMAAIGRLRRAGERNPAHKLTAAAVAAIRAAYDGPAKETGGVTQKELAARYGVTHSAVSAVIRGKLWRNP